MTAIEVVTARLEERTGYRPHGGTDWRCPAHEDGRPSLSVTNGDGRVLLHCQAGCALDDVLAALNLSKGDLFDRESERPERDQIVARYPYVDEGGKLLFEVVRFSPKGFRQRRPDGDRWVWKLGDVRRVLYRLPAVVAAVRDGKTIFVAEGEKDAEALERAGEVATTNPGGAGKWRPEYTETLQGAAEVIVVADADEAGRKHATEVARALNGVVNKVLVVEPPAAKDVAEHLAAGGTVDELVLIEPDERPAVSERASPDADAPPPTPANRFRSALVRGDAIRDMPCPAPLVAGLFDLDTLALLYGPSGGGKTFVALDVALSVATSTWWHGRAVAAGPVLYVVAEGLGGMGVRVDAWQQRRQVWTCGEVAWLPMAVNLLDGPQVGGLATIIDEFKPLLVVVDTFARCVAGGDENSAMDVGVAIEHAEHLRRVCGSCVLLVHHSGKDPTAGARGSSALRAAVSTEVECRQADGAVTLTTTKQRDHESGAVIQFATVPVGESLALEPYRGQQPELTQGALELLAELAAIADEGGVSSSVWLASSGVAARSFYRRQKALVDFGYCHKEGPHKQARYTVSDLGREALAR